MLSKESSPGDLLKEHLYEAIAEDRHINGDAEDDAAELWVNPESWKHIKTALGLPKGTIVDANSELAGYKFVLGITCPEGVFWIFRTEEEKWVAHWREDLVAEALFISDAVTQMHIAVRSLKPTAGHELRRATYAHIRQELQKRGARFARTTGGDETLLHLSIKVVSRAGGFGTINDWVEKVKAATVWTEAFRLSAERAKAEAGRDKAEAMLAKAEAAR